jgi:uncharacterized protein
MRLRAARIELLAEEILTILGSEEFIAVLDRPAALSALQALITEDLLKEEELDEDVRKILEQYADKMDQDRIQYHEMFKMVKEKLAKERNLIL